MSGILEQIEWIGSPNFNAGRDGIAPVAITMHVMDSQTDGLAGRRACDGWFKNPASQVSAHFGIGGGISQYVSTKDMAWANGILEPGWDQSIPWLVAAQRAGQHINDYTVSIEWAGRPDAPSTPAFLVERDYQLGLQLVQYLLQTYHIPLSRQNLIGHNRITPQSRARCPGPRFPWDRLFHDLGQPNTPPPHVVVPVDDGHTKVTLPDGRSFTVAYGFRDYWLAHKAETGFPIQEQQYDAAGDAWQIFENIELHWAKATNRVTLAPLGSLYLQLEQETHA